jgi:nicotinate-nucleotide adenylyltransferase
MGSDSWSEITTWREWERLLSQINHIVVTRPDFEVRTDHIPAAFRERIRDVRGHKNIDEPESKNGPGTIFFTDVVLKDVSATEVRRAARENRFEELERRLPAAVARYIEKYNLYRDTNEA